MNLQEVKDLYKNEFTTFEVYQFTSKRHSIHTDFIRELESHEYNDESEVVTHQLMDGDDYNKTILANSSSSFSDIYEDNDKILVIVIKDSVPCLSRVNLFLDRSALENAQKKAIKNGVELSKAGNASAFVRFLVDSYNGEK